jgi:predicted component of type VI protein secretion system
MNVQLVLERKNKRVWTARMRGPEATVGRALGSTVRIPSSEVSRLHCRLRVNNGVVTVEDLESVNGTFVNGVRVRGIETVRPGDRLTVGPATFVVEYELSTEALQCLESGDAAAVLEADDEMDVVEASASPLPASPDVIPVGEPIDEEEVAEARLIFDDEEMHLPDGGDLRDFLIELDDSDHRPKKRRR